MNKVSWQMGAEVKNAPEANTVTISVEEYQALIEAKVKLGVCTRHYESGKAYLDREDFNVITGFEILPPTKGEEKNGDTV